jgi:hypothetical protein
MNLDHIEYYEGLNIPVGKRTIQACYRIEREAVTSMGDMGLVYDKIKDELVEQIQKEMIKDLSGYFTCESLDEKDIEYITTISHGQLEKMRKLDELTKWMSIDEVEKVLHAYEALVQFGLRIEHE